MLSNYCESKENEEILQSKGLSPTSSGNGEHQLVIENWPEDWSQSEKYLE